MQAIAGYCRFCIGMKGGGMPRPNRPRTIAGEKTLARRIETERERRGWSYEGLASRMDGVGCPINASGIYKVEKAGRRITVDELVGLSAVFGVAAEDLLLPAEVVADRDLRALFDEVEEAGVEAGRAKERYDSSLARLRGHIAEHPEQLDSLADLVRDVMVQAEKEHPDFTTAVAMFKITNDPAWAAKVREQLEGVE